MKPPTDDDIDEPRVRSFAASSFGGYVEGLGTLRASRGGILGILLVVEALDAECAVMPTDELITMGQETPDAPGRGSPESQLVEEEQGRRRPVGRTVNQCMNCQEVRELVAFGLCVNCYRREQRARERDGSPFHAGEAAQKHSRDLARAQKRQRKALASILAALDDLVELLSGDDIQIVRQVIDCHWDRLRPVPKGEPQVNVELEKASKRSLSEQEPASEQVNSEQGSMCERSLEQDWIALAS